MTDGIVTGRKVMIGTDGQFIVFPINPPEPLELKCSHKLQNENDILQYVLTTPAKELSNFCLEFDPCTRKLRLKAKHPYYYQVQGQIY